MELNVKWDVTYKCNLNCAHCINGNLLGKIEDELSTEDVRKVIKKLKQAGVEYVHLLGGEPTAREDALEIFKYFNEENLNFGFNTNGLKLVKEDFRKAIVKNKNLVNVIFSLEGPNAEINDKIRGKKVFEVTTENLRKLIYAKKELARDNLRITVNTVVSRTNMNHIVEMIYFCKKLGVDEIVFLQFIPEGNGKTLNGSLSVEEELQIIADVAKCYENVHGEIDIKPRFVTPLAEEYAEKVLKLKFPKGYNMCGAGENFFYLNNKGELYPCDRYKKQIMQLNERQEINLVNNDFWEIATKEGFGELFQIAERESTYQDCEPCNHCKFLKKTCYPCPAQRRAKEMMICKRMMEEMNNV